MSTKHISSQFDGQLKTLSEKLLEMGQLVEDQISRLLLLFSRFDEKVFAYALITEQKINSLEMEVDKRCQQIIALHQPTAIDLRLLIAILKITGNLERAGDEALKIIYAIEHLEKNTTMHPEFFQNITKAGELAKSLFTDALIAFRNMDESLAQKIFENDQLLDSQFNNFAALLAARLNEKTFDGSVMFEYLAIAKAFERIGDHAKNISEFVVYVVKGADVRHQLNKF